jgi:glycolate oxidase FAD binding subunit
MPVETFRPASAEELERVVAWAAGEEEPLEVVAGGSKRALGRPVQAAHTLDLRHLSGIRLYEPNELVMSAEAGTPLAEVEAALAENRQQLDFEPADYGPLLHAGGAGATIGGVFACNLAGPRRVKAGAARDHLLGFAAVSGHGKAFKSGGRVVKNVTGYDLSKLMAGSYGTLAVMAQVTFKVLPVPEAASTVLLLGLDEERGLAALGEALSMPYDVSGAAHIPETLARRSGVGAVASAGHSVTAIRLEGPPPSVAYRGEAIRQRLAGFGTGEGLEGDDSAALWRELRDVGFFRGDVRPVWRLSVRPTAAARLAAKVLAATGGEAFFDWGGSLVWLAVEPRAGAGHEAVRTAVGRSGGHATLVRAGLDVRAAAPVFQPQPAALAALTRRVKESFDPKRILNPGRMYPDL